MTTLKKILTVAIGLLLPLGALAVTDKELEEARTIATKNYLRYVNNYSDYLDKISVKTVADLEKELKPTEKENIKAFKAIKVPSDYKSWDKAKLVEFWSVTVLNNPTLNPEGKKARVRIKNQINAMKIAAPTAEEKTPAAAAQEQKAPQENAEKPEPKTPAENNVASPQAAQEEIAAQEEKTLKAEDELESEAEEIMAARKEGSYTWVYILALAVLVAVVLWLVLFATKVFNKNNEASRNRRGGSSEYGDSFEEMEENFNHTLEEKNNEINMLSRKLENANRQNAELKQKLEALGAEVSSLRNRMQHTQSHTTVSEPQRVSEPQEQQKASPQKESSVRSIYLGRANSKGIFVRADRQLNPGNSIYRLETGDGISGVFRVADDPSVWELAMRLPREYLSFGCIGPDLEDTEGMTRIVNDNPGTAVFEGGCWRVTRKARIHYD